MKLLAWDTSSKSGAIVAFETAPLRLIAELTLNVDTTHSEQLLWGIHRTLEAARWKIEEVDAFGVGIGPGSFTGLRIGLTTARTLAHTLKKSLVPISSLSALVRPVALQFHSSAPKTLVIAATDACKGELFALFGPAHAILKCVNAEEHSTGWHSEVHEQVLSPKLLMEYSLAYLEAHPGAGWVAIGEGRKRYLDHWSVLPPEKEISYSLPHAEVIQGRYLGWLANEAIELGLNKEGLQVYPRYLRASDAELKLKAGLLAKAPVGAPLKE